MKLEMKYGLPFVPVTVCYRGKELHLKHVLLDTGSAGTIFSADVVAEIDIRVEPGDFLNRIRGVGGVEVVYSRRVDFVRIDSVIMKGFEIEIGDMNYGIEIDGILGFDFIREAKLIIDSDELKVTVGR